MERGWFKGIVEYREGKYYYYDEDAVKQVRMRAVGHEAYGA